VTVALVRRPGWGGWLASLALLAFSTQRVDAQVCTTAELRVEVRDSRGSPIVDSTVGVGTPSKVAFTHKTGPDGSVRFDLSCGAWVVRAGKDGFQEEVTPIQLTGTGEIKLVLHPEVVHSSVDVHATAAAVEQITSPTQEIHRNEVNNLPSRPPTVAASLPLIPGIVETPDHQINLAGAGEHRSALVVNETDVTDPATGKFGQTVPVDSVESVDVVTPFSAQYGNFTSDVVSVRTRRGGDKWHAELNDPLPGFRFRSWHLTGIRDETPRGVLGGPLIADRVFFITTLQYSIVKSPVRTLPYPFNESKQELENSFTQLDYVVSSRNLLTATMHMTPQHINFVNPDYFNPQPATPSFAQHNYLATVGDHLGIEGGMLDSVFFLQRFDATVWAQGNADMVLTPEGNRGNYFGSQRRDSARNGLLETFSPKHLQAGGLHELRIGTSVTQLSDRGLASARPVEVLNTTGTLLETIHFTAGTPFNRQDIQTAVFGQDHWNLTPHLSLDAGLRFERQSAASSSRIAPRGGLAWTPFSGGRTTIRGGYGEFYDRVPLSVFTFTHFPGRIITYYGPDGSILGDPVLYENVLGVPGVHAHFTPHSATWNAQIEQRISTRLRVRASYADTRSAGLLVLDPSFDNSITALHGGGHSLYRQAEVSSRVEWKNGQHLMLAYTRSRSEGNLNDFASFTGNFPLPLIRPNVYSNLAGDVPNRFLAWGRFNLPRGLELLPLFEYRTGFPYARYDALGNYVGVPNSNQTRFPNYFKADARILRDVKVNSKYTLRFSVSGFNLTNHFNALAVHANIDDPQYGVFFGNYQLRYRADFDVLF
jgi:TonB dependent receptor